MSTNYVRHEKTRWELLSPWIFCAVVLCLLIALFLAGGRTLNERRNRRLQPPDPSQELIGRVTEIGEKGYLMISLGAKDGVEQGMAFFVHGDDEAYIGRLDIVKVLASESVARARGISDSIKPNHEVRAQIR